jgi:dihydrofolate reductase
MEDPGGAEGFKYGGWTFEINRGPDGDKFKLDETVQAEALLLGRRTYEGFAAAWPNITDEVGFADKMNSMPKYVVSSTLTDPTWNAQVITFDDVPGVREQVSGNLLVAGSNQLAQGLLERDLIDELRLMVFPVVLGTGKRLFGETSDKKPLKLAASQTFGDGVVTLTYAKA